MVTINNRLNQEVSRAIETVLDEMVGDVINQDLILKISSRVISEADIEIVGTSEAMDILGVKKQRIWQLKRREAFPDAIGKLASTDIWLRKDIEDFDSSRQKRPGPAKKD